MSNNFFPSSSSSQLFESLKSSFKRQDSVDVKKFIAENFNDHSSFEGSSAKIQSENLFNTSRLLFQSLSDMYSKNKEEFDSLFTLKKINKMTLDCYLEKTEAELTPTQRIRDHYFFPGVSKALLKKYLFFCHLSNLSYYEFSETESFLETLFKLFSRNLSDSSGFEKIFDSFYTNIAELDESSFRLVKTHPIATKDLPKHIVLFHFGQLKADASKIWSRKDSLEVIISIRGTFSLEDVVTDIGVKPDDFFEGTCHSGIKQKAENIVKEVEDLFKKRGVEQLDQLPSTKFVFTGHSLGAAIANAAAMIMKDKYNKLDVQAYGFGCPPFISKELVERTQKYCTNIVFDDDLIARVGEGSILDLARKLSQFDTSKYLEKDLKALVSHFSSKLPTSAQSYFEKIISQSEKPIDLKEENGEILEEKYNYQHPGKLVHIYRAGNKYDSAQVPTTFFKDIVFSRTMIEDHFLEIYTDSLHALSK
eukprot:maker-scaffold_25-snap-gene-1.39-mRNA-1 protein AED:0.01 eAED:0.01 QI:142/1/1/1/0.66/0.5/4/159/476